MRSRKTLRLISLPVCIEHPDRPVAEWHHVVPYQVGGSLTVPLCAECHGKVHGIERSHIGTLIKQGIESARSKGVRIGRPKKLQYDPQIFVLRDSGLSFRKIAKQLDVTKSLIQRALKRRGEMTCAS